jgi:hypothetical protein
MIVGISAARLASAVNAAGKYATFAIQIDIWQMVLQVGFSIL